MEEIILDTGPLVAFLHRDDHYHVWAREQLALLPPPFLTCEAVLIQTPFHLEDEIAAVDELLLRYANVPMSFADACLVRMSEIYDRSLVWTLDGDFNIYRKHRNQVIPTILPPNQ